MTHPWYREFWVWFIIAPPLASIIAGLALVWISLGSADDLVVDDYRRIGRTFEQAVERDRAAMALNATVTVSMDRASGAVLARLQLDGPMPSALDLLAIHPTEAARDRRTTLQADEHGLFRGQFDGPLTGRHYLQVVPVDQGWRLTGELPADQSLVEL